MKKVKYNGKWIYQIGKCNSLKIPSVDKGIGKWVLLNFAGWSGN